MIRHLYDWTLSMAEHPAAIWILILVSFSESSFFLIPPDILLLVMCLAHRQRAWFYAAVCTVASVAGGYFGYGIGYFLFDQVGAPILTFYGKIDYFTSFQTLYQEWGGWIVAAGGFTPLPYKVITIASGAVGLDLIVFGGVSVLARGGRFLLVATVTYYVGPPIRSFIEAHFAWVTTAVFIGLIAGFIALEFLM